MVREHMLSDFSFIKSIKTSSMNKHTVYFGKSFKYERMHIPQLLSGEFYKFQYGQVG